MLSPRLLLAPIDFSDSSLSALNVAKDIAKQFGSTILLLHAMPVVPKLTKDLSLHGVYELELLETARLRLGDLAEKVQQAGVHARTIVGLANDAALEITRTAESEQADLIVISTHGLTGWRRFAFGSVAEKVVRTGPCSVLVVRGVATPDAKKQARLDSKVSLKQREPAKKNRAKMLNPQIPTCDYIGSTAWHGDRD
jgi:nucleotide-binding universal stress UspA family protein